MSLPPPPPRQLQYKYIADADFLDAAFIVLTDKKAPQYTHIVRRTAISNVLCPPPGSDAGTRIYLAHGQYIEVAEHCNTLIDLFNHEYRPGSETPVQLGLEHVATEQLVEGERQGAPSV